MPERIVRPIIVHGGLTIMPHHRALMRSIYQRKDDVRCRIQTLTELMGVGLVVWAHYKNRLVLTPRAAEIAQMGKAE